MTRPEATGQSQASSPHLDGYVEPEPVTVIGLGAMGSTLARAFLQSGHPTTVWNRTPHRAKNLVADGAVPADSVEAALSAGRLVVICVLDHDAVLDLLGPLGSDLTGRTIVNLTSSTPERARETAAWATARGADYLAGAIMVPTPIVRTPDALVLYSGSAQVFAEHRATLASLGGETDFLGTDAGLASLYDIGMLDLFFTGMAGFLHAAALVGGDDVTARSFLPYAQRITALLQQTGESLARDVDSATIRATRTTSRWSVRRWTTSPRRVRPAVSTRRCPTSSATC